MSSPWGTIDHGGVLVTLGQKSYPVVKKIGRAADLAARHDVPIIDCHKAWLIPGLINGHTHLELSHLAGQPDAHKGFTAWAESLFALMQAPAREEAIAHALSQLYQTGTVLAADMGGHNAPLVASIMERDSLVDVLFMIQRMGFAKPKDESLRPYAFARDLVDRYLPGGRFAYAGHALYSTHPRILQLTKAWCEEHNLPFALHLAESLDEVELMRDGTGPLAAVLGKSGLLPSWFVPSGMTPVACAHKLGLLGPTTLAVHCVHVNDRDVELLASTGTSVCLCPRSNVYIGVGTPPVASMRQAGIRLCLGTDGLSSNNDLDLAREMDAVLNVDPGLDLEGVLRMATRNAAAILGVDAQYGTIEPGKRACLAMLERE
ncbi:S-adenosylhomocysteine deaminase [Desulfoplanes formicivorans]|uniref:S-adenosylhomocysteine deaminase n=2 Tax=Desulfoplanes formicivorans TaxID=1592317 RepID=A0A194AKY2_9BACT|nr:S-adenosylhomocysteine deaminase [Desulfoplanes formicivorans]